MDMYVFNQCNKMRLCILTIEKKKSISRDKLYQLLVVHGCLSWRPTALLIYGFTIYYMNKEDNYNSTLSA